MKERIIHFMLNGSKRARRIRTEQYIVLAFLTVILVGAALLTLPVASRSGTSCGFLTALFTATSATCVTGLVVVDTYVQWTGFGQIVILCLIQIGGLGFMSIVSVFFFMLHRKIGLQHRLIIAQGFGLNDMNGVVQLVRAVLRWTFVFEATGAAILTIRFAQFFEFWRALRWGIFHSVSAFCNAGFDILGCLEPGCSLIPFACDPVVNIVIMALIVLGGLGFYVWMDLAKNFRTRRFTLHTRLVLCITGILIVGGAAAFAALEWTNPETLGDFSVGQKILASCFQSVTCRTAGFASVPQNHLTEASRAVSILLMLIGGSSGSTAGGIKTVTFGILVLAVWNGARGRSRVTVFHRTIGSDQIRQAMTIFSLMLFLAFGGAVVLSAFSDFSLVDCLFETASALGTVGLSVGITSYLQAGLQLLLIIFMFFGRVGITTFSLGFLMGNRAEERYHYAEAKVLIG